MSNTLATVNPTLIATAIAQELSVKFPALAKFSVNYTENIPSTLGYGGSFVVKNITPPATSLYVNGVGFIQQSQSLSDTTITFNKYRGSKVGFSFQEYSTPVVQQFMDNFAERAAFALTRDIATDLCSLVSSASYGNSQSFASSSAATRTSLLTSNKTLDTLGVTNNYRVLVVNHNYYAGLNNDPYLFNLFNPANSNVAPNGNGTMARALGFDIQPVDPTILVPTVWDGVNNLVGFAAHPSAIAFASLLPTNPSQFGPNIASNVEYGYSIEPNSGLQIAIARWFDPNTEMMYILPKVLYGFTPGVANALTAWISPSAL